jgi:hypothetical protein
MISVTKLAKFTLMPTLGAAITGGEKYGRGTDVPVAKPLCTNRYREGM